MGADDDGILGISDQTVQTAVRHLRMNYACRQNQDTQDN
jgi:hypothetical protein